MANINIIIPFILNWEAGLKKKYAAYPYEQMFSEAKKTGFVNDPDDSGGATMCGLTIATYNIYCKKKGYPMPTETSLNNMSFERWADVLKSLFWNRWKADDIISQDIANILVDWVWASGVNGIKIPQRILGVKDDGIVGAKTIAAINSTDPIELFQKIHDARIKFVDDIVRNRPSQKKFIKGWKRRINAIQLGNLIYSEDAK